jgi:fatty acid desaturase
MPALINQGASILVEQFREVAREATTAMLAELRRETATPKRVSRIAIHIIWVLGSLAAIALAGFARWPWTWVIALKVPMLATGMWSLPFPLRQRAAFSVCLLGE